jgi:hypothetical protein
MGSLLALIEPKTTTCRDESRYSLSSQLAKHHAEKYIVSMDEGRFYFSNHFDRIWLPPDE